MIYLEVVWKRMLKVFQHLEISTSLFFEQVVQAEWVQKWKNVYFIMIK